MYMDIQMSTTQEVVKVKKKHINYNINKETNKSIAEQLCQHNSDLAKTAYNKPANEQNP